ncbi:hypothetical protein Goari_019359 [Gossypium aridum]|uniref:DUF4283 domain-containing protein n=1 Tax=Gossypium aridum TaxID=34290 RepID=A0A7J8WSX2_GOSAI|nr:hypothetical protein [Gossypium aridum]
MGKRPTGKSFSSPSKKSKEFHYRTSSSVGFSGRVKRKDYPERSDKEKAQNTCSSNTAASGRPSRNSVNTGNSRSGMKGSTIRFEAWVPARAYAIRAREEAPTPDVITGTFSIFDTNIIALIDLGSTRSYGKEIDTYEFNFTPFWLRIYNIPLEHMDRKTAIDVGKAIEEVVAID